MRVIACVGGNHPVTGPDKVAVFDSVQNILPIFGPPAVIIFFLRVSGQINKTTLAALQAGEMLFHEFVLFYFCPLFISYSPFAFAHRFASFIISAE
jgi:hypothetical protein